MKKGVSYVIASLIIIVNCKVSVAQNLIIDYFENRETIDFIAKIFDRDYFKVYYYFSNSPTCMMQPSAESAIFEYGEPYTKIELSNSAILMLQSILTDTSIYKEAFLSSDDTLEAFICVGIPSEYNRVFVCTGNAGSTLKIYFADNTNKISIQSSNGPEKFTFSGLCINPPGCVRLREFFYSLR